MIMKNTALSKIVESNPNLGVYVCLTKLIKGSGMAKEMVRKLLKKFVPKEDYDPKDKEKLVEHLLKLSTK